MNKTEEIWDNFCCQIKAFIHKRVSNSSFVDDILQDVFLKIHSKVDTLKNETKIRSWVYQIAQNTIIDYYRKHKLQSIDIDDMRLMDEHDGDIEKKKFIPPSETVTFIQTDELNAEQEIALGIKEMLASLPEKYSQAIFLVEFEGLSQLDLAKRLGISVSGAKSRVQRGRQLLKDALMRCCHFEFDKYGTIINSHPITCCCCN